MSDESQEPKLSAAEDQWLDGVLRSAAKIEPSAALRRAVAEIPLRYPRTNPQPAEPAWFAGSLSSVFRFAFVAAVASVALGAWLGYEPDVLPELAVSTWTDPSEAWQADGEWEELAQLAFADELDAELAP